MTSSVGYVTIGCKKSRLVGAPQKCRQLCNADVPGVGAWLWSQSRSANLGSIYDVYVADVDYVSQLDERVQVASRYEAILKTSRKDT